jgi:hypothetical protein
MGTHMGASVQFFGLGYDNLLVVVHIKASVHHTLAKSIREIPVVREFLDVFLDDLPVMPPERDIEFKIELQPGTAPVAKSPYKLT